MIFYSYADSTRNLAVNLSGGAGEDLKAKFSEHKMMQKEDNSNQGISLDVQYLKQAEHLLRTTNYPIAIQYTVKALEINPESQVIRIFFRWHGQ